jgi:UDP-GlcNAc:undecaprenyl-phosphate GlcNAc-1-phosphate transferase
MASPSVLASAAGAAPAVMLAAVLAAACAAVLTRLLVSAGHRAGALDSAGASGHSKDLRRVPNVGGIAIVATVALPLVAILLIDRLVGAEDLARRLAESERLDALVPSAMRLPDTAGQALWILLATLALHALGLVDDRRALGPWPKLLAQVTVAAGTVILADVRVLTLLDAPAGGAWLSVALSVAFIVAMTNALNFLDNMDGLSGGVAAIAAASLAVAATIANQWATAGLLAVLAGALLGFLAFNFPWRAGTSARIFMGDGGSLPVGFLLAVLAMQITFTAPEDLEYALGTRWYGVLSPLVILAVPLYDAFTVSVLRLVQGKSPMVGDQQHFSHRLVMRGLSRRGAVLLICALAATCGVSGLLLGTAAPWQAVLIGGQVAVVLATIAALERPMLARMAEDRR